MGRLADGWFPQVRPGPDLDHALDTIGEAARETGRDPATIGMEGRVTWNASDPDKFRRQVDRWRDAGATHLTVDTMYTGLATVDDHLGALRAAAVTLELTR
jgi:hypothetical protein